MPGMVYMTKITDMTDMTDMTELTINIVKNIPIKCHTCILCCFGIP